LVPLGFGFAIVSLELTLSSRLPSACFRSLLGADPEADVWVFVGEISCRPGPDPDATGLAETDGDGFSERRESEVVDESLL
jgi:hypothetical protein